MKIKPEDLVEDVIQQYPATVRVFMDHDFPCLVCGEPVWGTVAENAERNNIVGEKFNDLMKALNETVSG
ncbi:MAG: hypothetical protein DRJ14_03185 [Acidobacteria bacterium]|nr:MAG: hypothetical protein DRJ14_03185 [Acidobacteriota bacterium]